MGVKFRVFLGKVISFFALLEWVSLVRISLVVLDLGPIQSGIVRMKVHSLLFDMLWAILDKVLAMNLVLYTGFTRALWLAHVC